MRYTLINCYADNNKGDLGIILATVGFLKAVDSSADIEAISTFNYSDPCFKAEHRLLQREIPVLPAVFGELNLRGAKGPLAKGIRFLIDSVRLFIYCLTPASWSPVSMFFFSKWERRALARIRAADHIVSKGGSFLCNERDARSRIALIRFLFVFFVCFKHRKKVTILCQSLGPVYGRFSRLLLNYVLRRCENIVLREDVCTNAYPYLAVGDDAKKLNDIAFFLDTSGVETPGVEFDEASLKVGVTIKYVERERSSQYLEMMARGIEYCVSQLGASVYVFPHVSIEDDLGNAYNVLSSIADEYKHKITVFSGDYTPQQLKKLYSNMDVFIGTRLHSTIFAMGEMVPSVCISYHGTKSIGVFSNFELDEYVVTEYSFDSLKQRLDKLMPHREVLRERIRTCLDEERKKFLTVLGELFTEGVALSPDEGAAH